MKATLIIPDSALRKEMRLRKRYRLACSTEHSTSHYGMGVMLWPDGEVLDGFNFCHLFTIQDMTPDMMTPDTTVILRGKPDMGSLESIWATGPQGMTPIRRKGVGKEGGGE